MSTIPKPSEKGDADDPGIKDPVEEVVVDDPLEGNPDTPLVPVETLLEAMRWAFEGEEIGRASCRERVFEAV